MPLAKTAAAATNKKMPMTKKSKDPRTPNSKTAAGGNPVMQKPFKDGGTVKLPKMMSNMKCG